MSRFLWVGTVGYYRSVIVDRDYGLIVVGRLLWWVGCRESVDVGFLLWVGHCTRLVIMAVVHFGSFISSCYPLFLSSVIVIMMMMMMMMMFSIKLLHQPRGPICGWSMYIYSRRRGYLGLHVSLKMRSCGGETPAIQPHLPPSPAALFYFFVPILASIRPFL